MHDNWQFPKFPPIPIEIFSVPDVENSSSRPISLYISYEKNYILDWKITCKSTFQVKFSAQLPRHKSISFCHLTLQKFDVWDQIKCVQNLPHFMLRKALAENLKLLFPFLWNEKWLKQLWLIVFLVDLVNFEAKFSRQLVWQQI